MVFLSQKVDGNMISTDYRKVLVLIFSEMGNTNTVFFWAKKLIERWHLVVTGKVLFWTFQWWKIRSFLIQEVGWKIIFTGYGEVLVLNFSVMGNTVFFSAKKLMERWYLHSLFEFSMIFQDLGNMVFRGVVPGEETQQFQKLEETGKTTLLRNILRNDVEFLLASQELDLYV